MLNDGRTWRTDVRRCSLKTLRIVGQQRVEAVCGAADAPVSLPGSGFLTPCGAARLVLPSAKVGSSAATSTRSRRCCSPYLPRMVLARSSPGVGWNPAQPVLPPAANTLRAVPLLYGRGSENLACRGKSSGVELSRPIRYQSSSRIVPMPRFLVNSELPLLPNRSR